MTFEIMLALIERNFNVGCNEPFTWIKIASLKLSYSFIHQVLQDIKKFFINSVDKYKMINIVLCLTQ